MERFRLFRILVDRHLGSFSRLLVGRIVEKSGPAGPRLYSQVSPLLFAMFGLICAFVQLQGMVDYVDTCTEVLR